MERHAAFDPLAEVQLKGETGLTDAESGQGLVRHGLRVDARHDPKSIATATETDQLSCAIWACEGSRILSNSWCGDDPRGSERGFLLDGYLGGHCVGI